MMPGPRGRARLFSSPLPGAMIAPMLRGEVSARTGWTAVALLALVGALAGALVVLGNPGNMGLCGACFLRDVAGALRLHAGPAYLRPEVAGLGLGALLWSLRRGRHIGRSGSFAVARFLLCAAMAVGTLVFLGCPFRLLQRLAGGDGNAWLALPGFVLGVWSATTWERRGYTLGKTQEVPTAVGLLGPFAFAGLLAAGWFAAGIADSGAPRAPVALSLLLALGAGAILSATGFCAISAVRAIFTPQRWMLWAALACIGGCALVFAITGKAQPGFADQPVAHGDWLWNTLALALVGFTGALAGGCPVRQLVMAGEGNGDAFVGCMGLLVGGALAHGLGLVAAPATALADGGPAHAGCRAVALLVVIVVGYAAAIARSSRSED
jgi:YedE family putative selenium metabolism protein